MIYFYNFRSHNSQNCFLQFDYVGFLTGIRSVPQMTDDGINFHIKKFGRVPFWQFAKWMYGDLYRWKHRILCAFHYNYHNQSASSAKNLSKILWCTQLFATFLAFNLIGNFWQMKHDWVGSINLCSIMLDQWIPKIGTQAIGRNHKQNYKRSQSDPNWK